ncbi:MAG: aspartate aminotransferase [Ignavibacteria bacterium]|nr:MAG: aspartate aminotransferase [Ignavibacteria bacterium]KAF0160718.1 MAG: aspartate aminotransferase [Ignavibacteria bacterium]
MVISKKVREISLSPTMKAAALVKELQTNGEEIIDLTVGEPDFSTPQNIKNAAILALNNNFTKYTNNAGTIELRKAIAKKLELDNGLIYSPEEIIVSAGAKQCIYNAIQSLVCIGDEVIVSSPYYVSYPEMVTLAQGKTIVIPTTEINGFKIKPQSLAEVITEKTKLLILCSPCNPTGTAYTKEELQELIGVIENTNIHILSDEIYEKVVYDDFRVFSAAALNEKTKSKTVTINGHSKSYSMTGWRLGYAAGPQHIISAMGKYQSHSTGNPSSISQAAALEALTGQQESVETARKEFERRRNFLHSELASINGITCYKPEGAFYLFPNISAFFNSNTIKNSTDLAIHLLNTAKVAVVPGIAFGAEGYIRISYSTSMENLIEGVERIKNAIEKI